MHFKQFRSPIAKTLYTESIIKFIKKYIYAIIHIFECFNCEFLWGFPMRVAIKTLEIGVEKLYIVQIA